MTLSLCLGDRSLNHSPLIMFLLWVSRGSWAVLIGSFRFDAWTYHVPLFKVLSFGFFAECKIRTSFHYLIMNSSMILALEPFSLYLVFFIWVYNFKNKRKRHISLIGFSSITIAQFPFAGFGQSRSSPRGTGLRTLALNGSHFRNRSDFHSGRFLLLLCRKVCITLYHFYTVYVLSSSSLIWYTTSVPYLQRFWRPARAAPSFWSRLTRTRRKPSWLISALIFL